NGVKRVYTAFRPNPTEEIEHVAGFSSPPLSTPAAGRHNLLPLHSLILVSASRRPCRLSLRVQEIASDLEPLALVGCWQKRLSEGVWDRNKGLVPKNKSRCWEGAAA